MLLPIFNNLILIIKILIRNVRIKIAGCTIAKKSVKWAYTAKLEILGSKCKRITYP